MGNSLTPVKGSSKQARLESQLHASSYVENGIPIVMPQQLGDNEIRIEGVARIGERDRDRLIRHVMCEGDIVFSRRGDVTRRAYITAKESGWLCGTGCLLLRLRHPRCDNRYLVRFLGLRETCSYLTQHAVGATMPNLNQGILSSVPVILPPKEHQARIVDAISAYDNLIENNRRRISLLEETARLLYREWFVHFRFPGHEHTKTVDGLPEGWERRALGDVVRVVKENVTPSDFEEDDVHVGLEHMPRRSFTLINWGPTKGIASGKFRFEEGDVLFCKIRPYFHKVGFTMRRGLVSSDALVWRVYDEADWPVVLCATSSDHFVVVASKTVREGSKMPRADWTVLREYEILKPSDELLA